MQKAPPEARWLPVKLPRKCEKQPAPEDKFPAKQIPEKYSKAARQPVIYSRLALPRFHAPPTRELAQSILFRPGSG